MNCHHLNPHPKLIFSPHLFCLCSAAIFHSGGERTLNLLLTPPLVMLGMYSEHNLYCISDCCFFKLSVLIINKACIFFPLEMFAKVKMLFEMTLDSCFRWKRACDSWILDDQPWGPCVGASSQPLWQGLLFTVFTSLTGKLTVQGKDSAVYLTFSVFIFNPNFINTCIDIIYHRLSIYPTSHLRFLCFVDASFESTQKEEQEPFGGIVSNRTGKSVTLNEWELSSHVIWHFLFLILYM